MSTVIPFDYSGQQVRTVLVDDAPWFVAADIARILEYRDASALVRGVEAEDRGTHNLRTPSGDQEMTVISEPGLYVVLVRARALRARPFQRWVTHDVLPKIRRTGSYGKPAPAEISRSDLARMVIESEEEKKQLEQVVETQRPAMEYHERFVAEQDDIITIDRFASQYGTTEPTVRDLMRQKNVAVRKLIGQRWSKKKQQMVEEYEWRPRQGISSSEWLVLRPQHNAPRLHNGQVRQTMYVRQFYVEALAMRLGLAQTELEGATA